MERCPACQARLREPPICGRCQADLSLALAAEDTAARRLRQVLECWAAGDRHAARGALEQSLAARRQLLALALRACLKSGR